MNRIADVHMKPIARIIANTDQVPRHPCSAIDSDVSIIAGVKAWVASGNCTSSFPDQWDSNQNYARCNKRGIPCATRIPPDVSAVRASWGIVPNVHPDRDIAVLDAVP